MTARSDVDILSTILSGAFTELSRRLDTMHLDIQATRSDVAALRDTLPASYVPRSELEARESAANERNAAAISRGRFADLRWAVALVVPTVLSITGLTLELHR